MSRYKYFFRTNDAVLIRAADHGSRKNSRLKVDFIFYPHPSDRFFSHPSSIVLTTREISPRGYIPANATRFFNLLSFVIVHIQYYLCHSVSSSRDLMAGSPGSMIGYAMCYFWHREQKAPRVTSKTYRTTETILCSGLTGAASACCILCRAASLMTG